MDRVSRLARQSITRKRALLCLHADLVSGYALAKPRGSHRGRRCGPYLRYPTQIVLLHLESAIIYRAGTDHRKDGEAVGW
jgi:hypothetical protein